MAKRVLFSGSIAGNVVGYGGNSWAFLQWVLGFRRLGFEVYYVEELRGPEYLDEQFKPVPFLESANACYFQTLIERFGLGDHAALLAAGSSDHVGLSREDVSRLAPDIWDRFAAAFTLIWILATRRSGRSSTASTCTCLDTIFISRSV